MTSQQDIPLYEEVVNGFDHLSDTVSRNESSGLRRTRRQAFERFREWGFPSIKSEDWKYTNINRFLKEEYALGVAAAPASAELVGTAVIPDLDCYTIVLVNGVWEKGSGDAALPLGLELMPVNEARQNVNLSGLFERSDPGKDRYFAALNTALFSDGLFIRVKAGALLEKPLHIIYAYTADHNLMVQPRHVWVIGERAEFNVIESVVSAVGDAHVWVNSLTEINLHTEAKVNHILIQTAAAGTRVVNHTTVRLKKK